MEVGKHFEFEVPVRDLGIVEMSEEQLNLLRHSQQEVRVESYPCTIKNKDAERPVLWYSG